MKLPNWPNPSNYHQIELGLDRVFALLERVENPHLKLPPTIHLAGTNGKGSTLSFLRAIFAESKLKVHAYTSPHLVNFNERIVVANAEISDDFLNECLNECRAAAEKKPQIAVTFFEGITVAAFLAFSRVEADLLLLETGLGGRLDATNVLPKVLASIITPIDFDHTDFLGKTLTKIAQEKAGIIKKNCPVFVGKQKAEVLRVLENQALKMGAKTEIFGRHFQIKKQKNGFLFEGFGQKILLPLPSLEGEHQIENAALAVTCALSLKFPITEKNLKSALTETFWRARLEKISSGKFFQKLPKNYELYLDGSHNSQGAATIRKFLQQKKNIRKILIFTMMKDKNCEEFLQKIAPEIDQLIAINFSEESRAMKADDVAKIAKKIGIKSTPAKNFDEAFSIISNEDEPALVLICGSLYLAGNFLEKNCKLEKRF